MTDFLRPCITLVLASAFVHAAAQAEECESNFASSGNILMGQTFKTQAKLPGVSAEAAYDKAYRAIAKQGFSIAHADRDAGVIAALNSGSRPDRAIPLNATIEPMQDGAAISLTFLTPAGAFSSENMVKTEFCKIVAAAAVASRTAGEPVRSYASNSRAEGPATPGTGHAPRMCLANACIGMTLEQAAKLNLTPVNAGPNFSRINHRIGNYGIDKGGMLVAMNSTSIDRRWIEQYLATVRTLCVSPGTLRAQTSTSDGTPVRLVFEMTTQHGEVGFQLASIMRGLPDNMSAPERKNFESEVRTRYGQALIERGDMAREIRARNRELDEAVAILNPSSLELLGPAPARGSVKLIEQPGCSNKARLD